MKHVSKQISASLYDHLGLSWDNVTSQIAIQSTNDVVRHMEGGIWTQLHHDCVIGMIHTIEFPSVVTVKNIF